MESKKPEMPTSEQIHENMDQERKKTPAWKRVLCYALVYILINAAIVFSLYRQVGNDLYQDVKQIYQDYACVHGIEVDGQWFRTADDLTAYLQKNYGKWDWKVIFIEYSISPYEYQYHVNKNL